MDHLANPNGMSSKEGYDPARLVEHYEAFDYLRSIYLNDHRLSDPLRAVLVLVNKADIWPNNLNYGSIIKALKH
jgi:hypothetical protein